ncbi:MAG: DUF6282 family protein [Bryobacteraceae bacterium]|nr:DUF6282 family protein [Bryobacteraceae bacterium]MDW8376526.1 DUF6282 family protein [Bryobacterales bacterium]
MPLLLLLTALGTMILTQAGGQSLEGVLDLHAHAGPDSVPRSIDALALAKLAHAKGFRGIVLKNHYEPTASWAALARAQTPGLEIFGGIVLNRSVGGINPAAVEQMTRVYGSWGRIVWMPTFDAENHVKTVREPRPFVSISRSGRLLGPVLQVLDVIAKYNLVLATGHSSPAESFMLIREAQKRQIRRIVVTHAMVAPVSMSVEQMREAAERGAMIEFVANAVVGKSKSLTFERYAEAMRRVGYPNCILSSDLGQRDNPLHPDGLVEAFSGLRQAGVPPEEIERMAKYNPARLLGLTQ